VPPWRLASADFAPREKGNRAFMLDSTDYDDARTET
jgi:hypothetical protein